MLKEKQPQKLINILKQYYFEKNRYSENTARSQINASEPECATGLVHRS